MGPRQLAAMSEHSRTSKLALEKAAGASPVSDHEPGKTRGSYGFRGRRPANTTIFGNDPEKLGHSSVLTTEGLSILGHQDDWRLQRGQHGKNEVEEDVGVGIEWFDLPSPDDAVNLDMIAEVLADSGYDLATLPGRDRTRQAA